VKKIQAFILLICLFLTVNGYHYIYQYRIAEARQEMHEMIRDKTASPLITTIELSPADMASIEWESAHEFRFHEKMYDLVSRKDHNGRVYLSCIADEKESGLSNAYREANRHNRPGNAPLEELLRLAATPFLQPSIEIPAYIPIENKSLRPNVDESLLQAPAAVTTPPPEFIG